MRSKTVRRVVECRRRAAARSGGPGRPTVFTWMKQRAAAAAGRGPPRGRRAASREFAAVGRSCSTSGPSVRRRTPRGRSACRPGAAARTARARAPRRRPAPSEPDHQVERLAGEGERRGVVVGPPHRVTDRDRDRSRPPTPRARSGTRRRAPRGSRVAARPGARPGRRSTRRGPRPGCAVPAAPGARVTLEPLADRPRRASPRVAGEPTDGDVDDHQSCGSPRS